MAGGDKGKPHPPFQDSAQKGGDAGVGVDHVGPLLPEHPAQNRPGLSHVPDAPPVEQQPPAEDLPAPEPPSLTAQPPEGLPPQEGRGWDGDMPALWEEPQGGDDRAARLRRHVMDALEGWQFYRHLARRARGTDARALNSLAGELHKHARKLSAAYFLLTGLRYWPTELLGAPAIPSYWGALRSRHQAEQRQETAFRLAADDWEDPDMLELYGELADACQQRCRRLRGLLEQGV